MHTFRLALAQINLTVGDLDGNVAKILEYTERAREQAADLVAFPEMAITGYPPEDLLLKPSFIQANVEAMRRVAAAARDITMAVGFVDDDGDIYNACALAHNGEVAGVYRKVYLPNYGVFDEERYFQRGREWPVYVINGVGVGINICEDIWYPAGPAAPQRDAGAQLVVNINASPYHLGKGTSRHRMVATRASDNALYVAYLNAVGGQDELVFDGDSSIFGPAGEMVARGPEFEESLVIADLDVEAVQRARLRDPRQRKAHPTPSHGLSASRVVHLSSYEKASRPGLPPIEPPPALDSIGQVYRALVSGTGDYVRKNGFQKVLIGLSGGIDSALTACVAADALGRENVLGVTMPSRYSSEGSVLDSRELADNLGIEMWTIPIEPAHTAFQAMLEPHFQGAWSDGAASGVAEENVQARIRGTILMSISNKYGWLVLTTGNKSELAMGYATLYGDMAGGFAVIKDVPKTMVYDLARWRNAHGQPAPVVPQAVLDKPPSAELRPDQTDQDSLPPYPLLDQVMRAYVEEDYSYQSMVEMGFDPAVVRQVITAADRNEYKRRQAPPGVKITPRAFGRDRRLPIVNRYRQF